MWAYDHCTLCKDASNLRWQKVQPQKITGRNCYWLRMCKPCLRLLWRDYTKLEDVYDAYECPNKRFTEWLHPYLFPTVRDACECCGDADRLLWQKAYEHRSAKSYRIRLCRACWRTLWRDYTKLEDVFQETGNLKEAFKKWLLCLMIPDAIEWGLRILLFHSIFRSRTLPDYVIL